MKKRAKIIVLTTILAFSILCINIVSYASGNISKIEKEWLDFQKVLGNQLVKDGIISKEEAEFKYNQIRDKAKESEEDFIYEYFSRAKQPALGNKKSFNLPELVWAKISNQSLKKVRKQCEDTGKSVWQLAESEGRLKELNNAIITELDKMLNKMVKKGIINSSQKEEALNKIIKQLESGNYPKIKEMLPN
jgi:polyhydroxyalkanoate synthesis regulator phasin